MIAGFLVSIPVIAVAEYAIHRWVMHRRWMWPISELHQEHTIRHHGQFYRVFDHEPDPNGRGIALQISYWYLAIVAIPLLIALRWSWQPAGMLVAAGLYLLAQNTFHSEMHDPRRRWFSGLRLYKFLCRYHYMHHRHTNRNFNATIPIGLDWIAGTLAIPTKKEWEDMRELGFMPAGWSQV